ncbi:MAG: hypothetical protein HC883_05475 [Bdellovibrionaceae bacterium]|nr:hypothetical protein [Pseudobdellovibrionaceae bacterium]
MEADIHFFQEVNPVSTRSQILAKALDCVADHQPDLVGLKLFGMGLPLNLNSGLVIATRKKWGMKPVAALSLSRPGLNMVRQWGSWQLKEERFALFCETLLPGFGRVLLVNTHLHHGIEKTEQVVEELGKLAEQLELSASAVSELKERWIKGNNRRAQELDVLLNAIEKVGARYEVVVLAGDLNSRPESALMQRLRDQGFRDAWAEANPSVPGLTFDAVRNEANHLLQRNFPMTLIVEDLSFSAKIKEALLSMARTHEMSPRRIDYLWFRSKSVDLKVQSAKLVGLPDETGLAPSDHFGVCADIEAV